MRYGAGAMIPAAPDPRRVVLARSRPAVLLGRGLWAAGAFGMVGYGFVSIARGWAAGWRPEVWAAVSSPVWLMAGWEAVRVFREATGRAAAVTTGPDGVAYLPPPIFFVYGFGAEPAEIAGVAVTDRAGYSAWGTRSPGVELSLRSGRAKRVPTADLDVTPDELADALRRAIAD